MQPAKIENIVTELLTALKLARQYVGATHGIVAGAVGKDNLVAPDLAVIDAAITKADLVLERLPNGEYAWLRP